MIMITVMYPNQEGSKFDTDYYINKHLPLVNERWSSFGMQDVNVVKGVGGGTPDAPPTYQIMTHLTFNSLESFQQAESAYGDELFGDVPNFTDVAPVVQISEVLV